jgi:hypothetical protein
MNAMRMTNEEIRRAGMAALTKAMGPTGAIRFIRHFDKGHGDYTAERAAILGDLSFDEIVSALKTARARRRRRPARAHAK